MHLFVKCKMTEETAAELHLPLHAVFIVQVSGQDPVQNTLRMMLSLVRELHHFFIC